MCFSSGRHAKESEPLNRGKGKPEQKTRNMFHMSIKITYTVCQHMEHCNSPKTGRLPEVTAHVRHHSPNSTHLAPIYTPPSPEKDPLVTLYSEPLCKL